MNEACVYILRSPRGKELKLSILGEYDLSGIDLRHYRVLKMNKLMER